MSEDAGEQPPSEVRGTPAEPPQVPSEPVGSPGPGSDAADADATGAGDSGLSSGGTSTAAAAGGSESRRTGRAGAGGAEAPLPARSRRTRGTTPAAASPSGGPAIRSTSELLRDDPLAVIPLVLAGAAALMLLGAILFALASASSARVTSADRFRLLGAAAHPVTALTALAAMALVVEDRIRATNRTLLAPIASGIATAVSLAIVLLGINGVLTDLTTDASAVLRLSTLVTRLAPIGLAGVALWLSVTSGPTARARRRTPTAGGG